ncbi:hypothetical protein N7492_004338 [Penicillium capsulatum]|uniref:Arf-GAP domain-containing protein n=1 Tax=Penicillium capsulatum TaxID=69766 RepID=A0A9W9LQV9_9EURO|nr:hypothetical protein N7492_004338 [Penicillium capsulatum]KAJ6136544.1 hypothetical protein N7512_001704 [Penicillium capsulatum]
MPNGISKRQQLRNEKALVDLIRTVPGNDRCADCDASTPGSYPPRTLMTTLADPVFLGWASWNMGLFLCMRCASIHRKLGTHISKVKSLTMDSWSSEQVDMTRDQNMKSHGNLLMNKIYNPKNVKPPIPTDIDEADSCMERFIRQKYQYRSLEDGKPKPPSREDESYTRAEEPRRTRSPDNDISLSPEGSPPPLPPKSGKFFNFGLRSSSSTSNLRRFGTKSKTTPSPTPDQREWSPPPRKKSTGLGAPVADVTTASFEAKMASLREMGFTNDRRNEMVLRGLNENLDKSIETLVRLGEGSHPSSRSRTPAPASNTTSARAVTPKPETSNNPFERAASNPAPQAQQPQSSSYNPFERPAQTPASAQPFETSFQNLQVTQPLFPHSTGDYPAQASSMVQPSYQQPFTPTGTSSLSQGGYVSSPQTMDNSYNPFFQATYQPQGGAGNQTHPAPGAAQNNPFFNNMQQPSSMQPQSQQSGLSVPTLAAPRPPQHANTMPAVSSASPFGTSPFGQSPFQSQPPQQPQPQLQPQTLNTGQGSYNPFQQSMTPTTPQSAGGYPNQFPQQPQPQPQQLLPQPTGRMDKGSILSLYNLAPSPSTIPPIPEQSQFQPGAGTSPVPPLTNSLNSTPQTQPGSNFPTPQPGAGNPSIASRNPFNGPAPAGSGLAAQAGIAPSSGLGIGMGANGTAAPAPAMGTKSPFPPTTGGFAPSNQPFPRTHMSQPSVDINGLQNGRHSPDAFASLSARYG